MIGHAGSRRRGLPGTGRSTTLVVTGTIAGVLLLAAGCTGGNSASSASSLSSNSAASSSASSSNAAATSAASGSAAAGAAAGNTADGPSAGRMAPARGGGGSKNVSVLVQGAVDRQVIKNATVGVQIDVRSGGKGAAADTQLAVDAVAAASLKVQSLVGSQGFVGAATIRGTTSVITLRVPVSGFDDAMTQLGSLGHITSQTEKADDVTGQVADLTSRVKTMKAGVNSVRTLLSKATRIGDVISVESELNQREADLESLQSQLSALSSQVSLSTITVTLDGRVVGVKPVVVAPTPPPPPGKTGFAAGLAGGWKTLKSLLTGVAAVAGALLPFLPLILVLAIAALIWRRRTARRPGPPSGHGLPGPVLSGQGGPVPPTA